MIKACACCRGVLGEEPGFRDSGALRAVVLSLLFLCVLVVAFSSPEPLGRGHVPASPQAVSPLDATPPVWPTGSRVVATGITPSSIQINWTMAADDEGVVNYKVYVDGAWDGMLHMANSFGMFSLLPNRTYTFQIVALDPSGNLSTGPSASFTTSPLSCTGYRACLVFRAIHNRTVYPGGQITFLGTFTNSGQTPVKVLMMSLTGDFGSLYGGGTPDLTVGQKANRSIVVVLPANVELGAHRVTFSVSWEYRNDVDGPWYSGSSLSLNSTLTVVRHPSLPLGGNGSLNPGLLMSLMRTLWANWPFVVIPYVVLASAGSIVVVRYDRKRRDLPNQVSQ